jgi:hypothetical protein
VNLVGILVSVLQFGAGGFEVYRGNWRLAGIYASVAIANGLLAMGDK